MSQITITAQATSASLTPTIGKAVIYVDDTTKRLATKDDTGTIVNYESDTDELVKCSVNDTTAGYLEDKIVSADNKLTISTLNDGSDEDVQLAVNENNIDHNSLTNTHNLTTDIDHDALTNFTATEHFTMLDEDDLGSDSDTQAATQQSIKAYVDALGVNPANTFTVSPSGGDYTTIQAALTANATANTLFVVYPGTYTNDTINFTANAQTVMTPSKGNNVIVTNSSQVVEAGDFSGCKIKNIKINFTPTTAINGIEVNDGSMSLDSCKLDLTTSTNIAGVTEPALMAVTGTGTLTTKFGEFTYQHTGNTTNGIKAMFSVANGGTIDCLRPCESSMTNSGTAAASAIGIDSGTGVLKIVNACNLVITDTGATLVAGLGYIGGSGADEFAYCKIKVVGSGSNTCYGIYNGGTGSIRSLHNIIEVVSGTANYGFFTGASATTTSIMDDIRAADKNSGTGIFIQASSNADGEFSLYKEADPNLVIGNVTKEDIEGGRESSVVFKGKQSGGEETTLAKIVVQHDGTGDDQKGDWIVQVNDGNDGDSPTERLRIDSAGLGTLTGTMNATVAYQLNGTSINTGGTLSNVAYLDQANNFTESQTMPSVKLSKIITATASTTGLQITASDGTTPLMNVDTVNGRLGFGTISPTKQISITKDIHLVDTTASDEGVIYKGSYAFFHNFSHPTGGSAKPTGRNFFVGPRAGNFTMGSTATSTDHASFNLAIGDQSLLSNQLGFHNTAIGYLASALNQDGAYNIAIGAYALYANVDTDSNVGIGYSSGRSVTGGSNSIFIGSNAGFNASQKTDADNVLCLGSGTYCTTDDTYMYGNTDVEKHIFQSGNVGIATESPSGRLDVSSGSLSLIIGADSGNITRTNETNKNARIGAYHYTNAEEPTSVLFAAIGETTSNLYFGGGSSTMNAATNVRLYAGSSTTQTTGAEQMNISYGRSSFTTLCNYARNDQTISGGAVTTTSSFLKVDTEASAASDDLDTINGGSSGDILIVRASSAARDVTFKDGTGNLLMNGSADFTTNSAYDNIVFIYIVDKWIEISRTNT